MGKGLVLDGLFSRLSFIVFIFITGMYLAGSLFFYEGFGILLLKYKYFVLFYNISNLICEIQFL